MRGSLHGSAIEQQPDDAVLIPVEFTNLPLTHSATHEATQVRDAKPGFGFEEEGVQDSVVADEEGGGERCGHWVKLLSIELSPSAVKQIGWQLCEG